VRVHGAGRPLRLVHDEPFQYDVQRRIPDTRKAREVLGFEATTTLDTMLDELLPWVRDAIARGQI
jgi:nucleoside-diphosphate-sugar epimerase